MPGYVTPAGYNNAFGLPLGGGLARFQRLNVLEPFL